jgi:hypothetical protein
LHLALTVVIVTPGDDGSVAASSQGVFAAAGRDLGEGLVVVAAVEDLLSSADDAGLCEHRTRRRASERDEESGPNRAQAARALDPP